MSVSIPTGWLKRLLIPLELGAILILLASPANAAEPMALGIATQPSAALLQIAVERGLLEAEGVDATVTRYPSGKRALLDGLFAGKAQVISTADAPIVANAFKRDDFAVIGTIFFAGNYSPP
jgi:ABC-type nitrate/sulfonate/bicarbonate transport system substrate-binding protein